MHHWCQSRRQVVEVFVCWKLSPGCLSGPKEPRLYIGSGRFLRCLITCRLRQVDADRDGGGDYEY